MYINKSAYCQVLKYPTHIYHTLKVEYHTNAKYENPYQNSEKKHVLVKC